ncbi:MAG TPA: hypothetical protein VGM27_30175 [Acidobacteriaceae bacterium]
MRLGRVRSTSDSRTLQLRNYVTVATLPVPPAQEMLDNTASWPMLANDRFNCCTSAAAGHMVHHWTAANQHGVFLTDDDIIRAHAQLTSDRLMDCVSMLDALKFWRRSGIGDHRVHSYVSAGHANPADLRCVIHLFGSAYIGLDLPHFACSGDPPGWPEIPWEIPASVSPEDAAPQLANGHCVAAVGYNDQVIYVVTWGRLKTMSWNFFERYTDEVYAVLSADWVQRDAACPSGFDMTALAHDQSLVSAESSKSLELGMPHR